MGNDVYVGYAGDGWLVRIEGLNGLESRYESRNAAVEAGRRAAQAAGSRLKINLGVTATTPHPGANSAIAALARHGSVGTPGHG